MTTATAPRSRRTGASTRSLTDGKLRQYGPGPAFKKEREVVNSEASPESVAVDPRGQLVAVGI